LTVGARAGGPDSLKSQLIFFLSPEGPVCKKLLPVLKSIRSREQAWLEVGLASDGGDIALQRQFVERHRLNEFQYVVSAGLGVTYGIRGLPDAVLIEQGGTVNALGLVNSREHLESLFEAKRLGISILQQHLNTGKSVPEFDFTQA